MPGKKPRLGYAEQYAEKIESVLVAEPGGAGDSGDERHGARQDSPAQHDTRDPFARAEAFEQQVGGNFEEEIGEEEDPGSEAERGRRQAKVTVHRQRGKAHIDAVEIGDEIT